MSSSMEISSVVPGGTILCPHSLFLVDSLLTGIGSLTSVTQIAYLPISLFVTLFDFPRVLESYLLIHCFCFVCVCESIVRASCATSTVFSTLIITFFIRELSLRSHIILYFLNSVSSQIPVKVKSKIYTLDSLTVSCKASVFIFTHSDNCYVSPEKHSTDWTNLIILVCSQPP